jgi:two-component system, OmpR family, sensor histidine kinase PrrB
MRHHHVRLSSSSPSAPIAHRGWEPGLRMLVDNLIKNAAVHGRPGGQVQVTLGAPAGGNGPLLVVEDDGPGIPDAQRERIFEPFARSARHRQAGLRARADARRPAGGPLHGAEIAVDGSSLGGARFSVRLPAQPAPDGSGTATAEAAG